MKRWILAVLVWSQAAWISAESRLTLAGSSTVQPVMEEAAQAFEKSRPEVRVDVQGGGSAVGITAPRRGLAQIGMVSRDLHDDEKADLTATPIALDGLAIIVHASNPLKDLTQQQVIDIFSGKAANWKAVGGRDAAVTVINKEEGRATLELFEKHFNLKGRFVKNAVIIGPNGQAIASVAGNPDSIAYVSIGSAAVAEQEGVKIRRVRLDGVEPTVENVKNGAYGLRRPLCLVTRGAPSGLAKEYMDFVLSPEGQRIVLGQEFVPVAGMSSRAGRSDPGQRTGLPRPASP
jgi:phosphate transport system substrate-binding protein